MAQEYYTLERAAEVLKISTGEVNRMREQSQLRAFRDGSNWKFRKEDVEEALANQIKKRNQQAEAEEAEEILTFGLEEETDLPTLMADSDPSGTDDGLSLVDEDSDLGLSLDIEETISYDSPQLDLTTPDPVGEDDELVFGGGSDLNLGSGSGLSLVDPSEDEGVLELDEESDILALADSEEHSEVATLLAEAGDIGTFDLIADTDDSEESESSSQVIALDDDSPFGAEIPDFGPSAFGDESMAGTVDFGSADSSDDFGSVAAPVVKTGPSRSPYEATYSGKAVIALGLMCVLPVGLAGLMVYDLVRNMWSWTQPAVLSSPIVDMIAGMLGWR